MRSSKISLLLIKLLLDRLSRLGAEAFKGLGLGGLGGLEFKVHQGLAEAFKGLGLGGLGGLEFTAHQGLAEAFKGLGLGGLGGLEFKVHQGLAEAFLPSLRLKL